MPALSLVGHRSWAFSPYCFGRCWRVAEKLRLLSISIMKLTMCLSGMVSRSFMCSPRSQTASYAAVRSGKPAPAFSPAWKLSSMSWHRRVTWSFVDLPLWKPACSLGSWGSIPGLRRARIRRLRSLYGTQSNEMGRYPLGSSLGLFGFGRVITLARRYIVGSFECWRPVERKERSQSVALVFN